MNLTYIEDLVVDEQGEVIEWPGNAPDDGPGRIAYLIGQKRAAKEGKEAYETAERTYAFVVGRLLGEAGVGAFKSEYGNASKVADGETKVADPVKVAEAASAELVTHTEAEELLIRAAKALDVPAVEDWINEQDEQRRPTLRAVLISKRPRKGYVRITAPTLKPPRVRVEQPEGELAEQLTESIAAVTA